MNFVRKIISRWPVNGVVLCHVNDINFKMLCKEDEPIANGSFYWGFTKLSLLELTIFSRVCQRSLNIADIGANVGLYSIIGALSNPKAKITAFEPGIENYNRLQHNVELNGIRNISVENVALSDTTGDLAFNESEDGGISVFSSAKREQVELFTENVKQRLVESITLDDWCKRVKEQFDLIKIDVELFEYEVLKGAVESLKFKPVIFIEVHNYHVKNARSGNKLQEDFNILIEEWMKKYAYFFYELSEIGVYRVDTLQHSALAKNYLFLPFETKDRYYPIRRLDDFINSFI